MAATTMILVGARSVGATAARVGITGGGRAVGATTVGEGAGREGTAGIATGTAAVTTATHAAAGARLGAKTACCRRWHCQASSSMARDWSRSKRMRRQRS